jgi:adenylate cyclase class 2
VASEVEIKFLVHNLPALESSLQSSGFRQTTPRTHEMNTLYDRPNRELQKKGELLRLREYGTKWTLTHKAKGKSGAHKSRVETETPVSDGEQMHAILLALGFEPSFRYEKFRAEWSDGKGHVVLDKTPIGNVAEIEGEPEWIDHTAAALGVDRKDYITSNYADLFREWKEKTRSKAREMTFAECGTAEVQSITEG